MTSTAQYRQRQAAGLCPKCGQRPPDPLTYVCAPCQETIDRTDERQARPGQPFLRRERRLPRVARQTVALLTRPPGPQIGHCGTWHSITSVPMACPTCGRVLLQKMAVPHVR